MAPTIHREWLEVTTEVVETEGSDSKPLYTATMSIFGVTVAQVTAADRSWATSEVKKRFAEKLADR